jgi:hypothetical protein
MRCGSSFMRSFGLPEVLVAVSTSRLSCKRAGKTRTLMPVWDSSGESRFNLLPNDFSRQCLRYPPNNENCALKCLLRLYVFNLNSARYSTRPYNEGWRFHS